MATHESTFDESDTRSRLLDTAERLFAEHGISETSLRQITGEAGANLAAVNYHFGSKDELVLAVFSRRIGPLNEERLARLDAVESAAGSGPPSIEAVLEAFLLPALVTVRSAGRGGQDFLRLVGRAHTASDEMRQLVFAQFEEVFTRFVRVIRRAVPHLSEQEAVLRLKFTVGAMVMTFTPGPVFERVPAREDSNEEILAHLVWFLAAGFRAKGGGA